MREYRICERCIMDTSDQNIYFDNDGNCNHCNYFFDNIKDKLWLTGESGSSKLKVLLERIKFENKENEYDGIIGLSGGVDSSFLLSKLIEWGIRPLAVHVDAGWNSEIAVKNIEQLCRILDVELHTIVVDWESMREVQLAFLRSGVENQDIPQDHAIFAALYNFAVEKGIKNVFSGSNFATESILPTSWGFDAMDSRYLKFIIKKYGSQNLTKNYPIVNFLTHNIYYPIIKRMNVVNPLNYIKYNKTEAIKFLEQKYNWRYYGQKHGESLFTRFFQDYILPKRFGYKKKRAHLSSLIVSGEMSREQALVEINSEVDLVNNLELDKEYIIKKLGLTYNQFSDLIEKPLVIDKIPSNKWLFKLGSRAKFIMRLALKRN